MPKLQSAMEVMKALLSPQGRGAVVLAARTDAWLPEADCPCCGYHGKFTFVGVPVRPGALCPRCKSLERHRLFYLAHQSGAVSFKGKDILHFAPEAIIQRHIKADGPKSYVSADIAPGRADIVLNIEAIDKPDASFDQIVCFHVLEHVDDRKAMAELHRILRPGGELVAMVPIVEGWSETYENPQVQSPLDRERHFGLDEHVRYYGANMRDRLLAAGFAPITDFTAFGADCVRYGLQRGEKVFFCRKAAG